MTFSYVTSGDLEKAEIINCVSDTTIGIWNKTTKQQNIKTRFLWLLYYKYIATKKKRSVY